VFAVVIVINNIKEDSGGLFSYFKLVTKSADDFTATCIDQKS
jgi:hypothetical protein